MTTANSVGTGMRAPWRRLLAMALGLVVTAGIAMPAAAQTSAGIVVAPGATSTTSRLQTTDGGGTAEFAVTLATGPTANVVLDVASSDTTRGTVLPASLTFTSTTWNAAQTVTLTGVNDMPGASNLNPIVGNQNYQVTLTVNQMATGDARYDAVSVVTVYAVNTDNEYWLNVPVVLDGGLTVTEGGSDTFTVELTRQPAADVMLTVASTAYTTRGLERKGTVSPGSLTFTSMTWNTAQIVMVTGKNDDINDGDVSWAVTITASSSDNNFNSGQSEGGLLPTPPDVPVSTTDNDRRVVTLVLTPSSIDEGGTATTVATVTAELSGLSSEAVTLTVTTPSMPEDYTQSGMTLIIAAEQTKSTGLVTITAVDNLVHAQEEKKVEVSATATGGNGVNPPSDVKLTIKDDDEPGLEIVPPMLALEEQTTDPQQAKPYTVRLKTQPTAAVTVRVTPEADNILDEVMVAPMSLTFDTSDWATAKTVTVTALRDEGNDGDDEVTLKHTAAGASEYISLRAAQRPSVTVRVTDVDPEPVLKVFEMGDDLKCELQNLPETLKMEIEALDEEVECKRVDVPSKEERNVRTATGLFSLGTATAHMVVDIDPTSGEALKTLNEVLGNDLRVDMAVPVSLQNDAKNINQRMLHLLHLENEEDVVWKDVGSGDVEAEQISSDDPLESFFLFALAFENLKPTFDKKEPALEFMTGIAKSVNLPEATGGNQPLSYWIVNEEDLPDGLKYDRQAADSGMITGTPTTPTTDPQPYTLIVRDKNGDEDTLMFTIEVTSGIQSRDLGLVLAGVGRTLATDAVEILGGRFGSSPASRPQVTLGGQALRLTPAPPSPSSPAPSHSSPAPSPLAGEGRGEGSLLQGEPQKAGGSSPSSLQQATGLALSVARALGITLDLPSSSSSPSPSSPAPSPLAGEGRGEGAPGERSLLQNNAPLLGRFPADRSRSATPSNLFRLQPVSAKDLLARSAFELPLTGTGDDGVPAWTLWGRGSAAGFAGQPEDDFKMDGTLYSGYVGVDYRPQSTVLLGLALAHSTGEVSYERTGATKAVADVELTSMLPYMHWQPRPGLGVWGLAGAGWGKMGLKVARDPQMHTTGLTSWLGAVGGRQALTTWQGIDLAAKTDAFMTLVRSAGKTNLPGARGHAQRVRLLMEGRTAVALSPVSLLSPRLQLGGRWDSGTAEQGLGAELGGGVAYTRTDLGLSVEAQGRYLLVHEDGAFEDWGASVNVRVDPGVAGQGAYLTVAPVWGQAASGVDQLWGNAAGMPQVVGNTTMPAAGWRPHRLAVDLGYGLALADGRGFLTPYGGLALAGPGSSRYRLGSRLALSSSLAVNVEAERAEQPGQATAHGVSVRLGWQW